MRRIFALLVAGQLAVACGGGGDGGEPPPPAVGSVSVSPSSASLTPGQTVTLAADVRDAAGATLTGRAVQWASSNASVATVSTTGVVTAVAVGQATISATVDSKTGSADIVVAPLLSRVVITAPNLNVEAGQTVQLSASPVDAQGTAVPGVTLAWASSNEAVATVSSTGLVTTKAPGTVTIQAASSGVVGAITLIVRPVGGAALTVSTISPATLTPGATATITGTNFSTVVAENTVTVGGVLVTVTTASPTQLTVLLNALPCQALGNAEVTVSSPFGSGSRAHPVQSATLRTLAVGQALLISDEAGLRCNEITGGGRFMVAVVNTADDPSSAVPLEIRGTAPAAAVLAAVGAPLVARTRAAPPRRDELEWRPLHDASHARLRAADRALLQRLGVPPRRSRALSNLTAREVPLTVGARDTLRIRDMENCRRFTNVPARVVHVGPRSVILEADDSPLAGQMDADYQEIGREYDETMYPIITTNFGSPIAYDAQTDNNGRIIMLFTRIVNSRGAGLLGFVSACDFFPPTIDPQVAASNQAEVFYARVPTLSTETWRNTSGDEKVQWKWRIRSTLIHEAKHIASFAEKFQRDAEEFEDSWLEEGSAQVAEELYGRTFWATQWKGNATYRQTMYCDVRPNPASFPECPTPRPPRAIGDHMIFLSEYLEDHEGLTFLSSGSEASHIYGSAWAFLRFLIDNYATSEAAFLRALTEERVVAGVRNVEARTGRPFAELAAHFALAMATDDLAGFTPPAGAKYAFPTWNMTDIWSGANSDFPSVVTSPNPFVVRTAVLGTAFSSSITALRGGSATVADLAGDPSARQVVEVRNAPAGTPLRLAILRVK